MTHAELKARALARETEAFNLRRQGLKYREVGERLGVKKARAHYLVIRHERRIETDGAQPD